MCQHETHEIDTATSRALYERQNWRCHYCDCEIIDPQSLPVFPSPAYEHLARRLGIEPFATRWRGKVLQHTATIDHIVPVIEGGNDAPKNIVGACRFCNGFKSHKPYDQAHPEIEELIRQGKHPCIRI